MKRLIVLCVALAAGCSQAPVAAAATLVGAHDMVLVDKLLFTTSTDRDELRVLDLAPPSVQLGTRQFVRAPNPLEALSIPVLGRPSALARDSRFIDTPTTVMGKEVGGPWVYATRSGGSEISVVGGGPAEDPTQLVEVRRIPTSGPVTASAGASISTTLSRLFFATFDGTSATLQSVDLPATVPALKAISAAQLTRQVRVFAAFAGEVIVDLVVVPGVAGRGICEDPTRACVVLATRAMQGTTGRVLLFDPESLAVRELQFPGPIRFLAVHAATTLNDGTHVPAGKRVFGLLDEERCGGPECGGVMAVDTFTGQVALDVTGLPMLPITTGGSLATGLAVVARGQLLLPPSLVVQGGTDVPAAVDLSAAGVITTSNGAFIFFDANGLTPFDLNSNRTVAAPINIGLYQPNGVLNQGDGGFPAYVAGPVLLADGGAAVSFANGAWRSEVIDIVVNGLIPGLEDVAIVNGADGELPIPPSAIGRARPGDILIFDNPAGGCRTTVAEITATGLRAAPSACIGATRFAVRAAGEDRYVVAGTLTGYLGRSGPTKTFEYRGGYFRRSLPFDPNAPTFTVMLGPEVPSLEEDWRWSIDVQPEELPFVLKVSSQAVGCSTNVAGSVLWDIDRQAIFSVFPSANGIVEITPRSARNGVLEEGDFVQCYR